MCPLAYAASPLLVTPLLWIGETRPFLGPPVRPFGPELATLVGSRSFGRAFMSSTLGLGLRFPSSSSAWDRISSIRSVSFRVLFLPRNPPRWGSAYLKEGWGLLICEQTWVYIRVEALICVLLLCASLWKCIAGEWGCCLSIRICSLHFRQLAPLSRYTWSISTWQLCTLNKKVAAFSARTLYTGISDSLPCNRLVWSKLFKLCKFGRTVKVNAYFANIFFFWTSWVDPLIVMIQLFRLSRFFHLCLQ